MTTAAAPGSDGKTNKTQQQDPSNDDARGAPDEPTRTVGRIVASWVLALTAVSLMVTGATLDVALPLKMHAWVIGGAFASAFVLGGAAFVPRSKDPTRSGFALAGIVALASAIIGMACEARAWGFLFGLLPASFIGRHALYVGFLRANELGKVDAAAQPSGKVHEPRTLPAEAIAKHRENYSPAVLAIRYGLPALAIMIVSSFVFAALFTQEQSIDGHLNLAKQLSDRLDNPEILRAARLGAVGAYVYVLITLGERGFRRDITTGIAQWSALILMLGPIMSGATSLLIDALVPAAAQGAPVAGASGDKKEPGSKVFGAPALYFIAGFSPRYVATLIEEAVRRLWGGRARDGDSRTLSLLKLRGVTPEIADRLYEEEIFDAYTLAMADPLRLLRNTNFDLRQIAAWMDEALLYYLCGPLAESAVRAGFSGAIEMAVLHDRYPDYVAVSGSDGMRASAVLAKLKALTPEVAALLAAAVTADDPRAALLKLVSDTNPMVRTVASRMLTVLFDSDAFIELAKKLDVAPQELRRVCLNMNEDAQVDLIWSLYNMTGKLFVEPHRTPSPLAEYTV